MDLTDFLDFMYTSKVSLAETSEEQVKLLIMQLNTLKITTNKNVRSI